MFQKMTSYPSINAVSSTFKICFGQNQVTSYNLHCYQPSSPRSWIAARSLLLPFPPCTPSSTLCGPVMPAEICSQTCLQGPEQSGPSHPLADTALDTRSFCSFTHVSHVLRSHGLWGCCAFPGFSSSKYWPKFPFPFFRPLLEYHLLSEAL